MRFQSLTVTLTLFLSFVTNRSFSRGQTIDSTDVIIGGAGYSGVSTANVLDDNGVSFIIVEASDRIGKVKLTLSVACVCNYILIYIQRHILH